MAFPTFPAPDDVSLRAQEEAMAGRMGRDPAELGRAVIGPLALMQGGCVARWQLRWLDFPQATISDMVRREEWTTMHAGVWLLPGSRNDLLARTWAGVLAVSSQDGPTMADARLAPDGDPITVVHVVARERAVVTGETAAWMRGMTAWEPPREPMLLLDSGHGAERRGVRCIRTQMDRDAGATRIGGLRVAGGARLLWDVAWVNRRQPGAVKRLIDLAVMADRTRVMPIDDLIALVDEPCQFGLPMRVPLGLRQAAEALRPGFSHSATEALGRRIAGEVAAELGVEVHPRPYPIRRDGRIVAEADIAVLTLRHDLEIDGPHHKLFAQRTRDRQRDAGLGEIHWAVTRYPVELLDADPRRYADQVGTDLRQRIDEAA